MTSLCKTPSVAYARSAGFVADVMRAEDVREQDMKHGMLERPACCNCCTMTRVRTCKEGVDALRLGREAAQVAQVGDQQRQRLLDAVEREADLRQQLTRLRPHHVYRRHTEELNCRRRLMPPEQKQRLCPCRNDGNSCLMTMTLDYRNHRNALARNRLSFMLKSCWSATTLGHGVLAAAISGYNRLLLDRAIEASRLGNDAELDLAGEVARRREHGRGQDGGVLVAVGPQRQDRLPPDLLLQALKGQCT